ncbi:Leucine-rich repeat neuronal protein 1 [Sarcoptes scabiei]|uniref:Leucine-rich repeat neuronal protein 1 n=1 Tax=Sarcoptes scabiei TaxID=52283 RepID=A0A834R5L7_SARSC|nr:Leucine-rich repeat neuronal protein 1 [Sarcoptes scabiei]
MLKFKIIIVEVIIICFIVLSSENYKIYKAFASRTCPRGCDCIETELKTNCTRASQLEYVPHTLNPALKKLYLPNNKIGRIDSAFDVYKNLIYLDLTSNLITTIVNDNFKYNSQLQAILLANNTIEILKSRAFVGLDSLLKLDLSENRIDSIDDFIFKNLHSLQTLDLSYNRIEKLNSNSFFGLKNLLHLNISNNKIRIFSTELFAHLPKLINLNSSFNQLERLEDDWFIALNDLIDLDLSSSKLEFLSQNCFNGLIKLTSLSLQNNSLMTIPTDSFFKHNNIQILKIGQNPYPFIPARSFYNLKNLKSLYITNASDLMKIHSNALYGLENLEIFELSNNKKLNQIDRAIFDSLFSLSSLILSNNNFENLEINLISRFNKYDLYLDARGNPFNCNCTMEWLNFHLIRMFNKTISANPDYFLRNNITFPIYNLETLLNNNISKIIMKQNALDVRCSSPFALKDKLIIKLHKDKFGCFLLESIIPIVIGGIIGFIIISGVIILMIIQCRNQLSGLVKNQFHLDGQRNQFDMFSKPEFVFIYGENYAKNFNNFEDFSVRYPLKPTPTTEL